MKKSEFSLEKMYGYNIGDGCSRIGSCATSEPFFLLILIDTL